MTRAVVAALVLAVVLPGLGHPQQEKIDQAKAKIAAAYAKQIGEQLAKGNWERGIRIADQALRLEPNNGNLLWKS